MTKAEALAIFTRELVRELLREDSPTDLAGLMGQRHPPPLDEDPNPQPRFDFDESADTCTHNGITIYKVDCPVHNPEMQGAVSAEELDDLTSETFAEENPMIARARRLAEQKRRQEAGSERLFPEDLPNMKGAGPPADEPPPVQ